MEDYYMYNLIDHIIDYQSSDHFQRFLADYQQASSQCHRLPAAGYAIHRYDSNQFPFASQVIELLRQRDFLTASTPAHFPLEQADQYIEKQWQQMDGSQQCPVAISLYETNEEFVQTFQRFIHSVIYPLVGTELYYQQVPTFRVFFPEATGYLAKPVYHNDIMLGHPPQELNIWLPLGHCQDSASLSIMTLSDSQQLIEDYQYDFKALIQATQQDQSLQRYCQQNSQPITLEYGQFLLFDSRCIHAGGHNTTSLTRFSLDFRVIGKTDYHQKRLAYRGTGRRQMKFERAAFYSEAVIGEAV